MNAPRGVQQVDEGVVEAIRLLEASPWRPRARDAASWSRPSALARAVATSSVKPASRDSVPGQRSAESCGGSDDRPRSRSSTTMGAPTERPTRAGRPVRATSGAAAVASSATGLWAAPRTVAAPSAP